MPEDQQEITQERWIAWAQRVFKGRDVSVEFLDEEWDKLFPFRGNVEISIAADHDIYEYVTLYFDFNHPPIF